MRVALCISGHLRGFNHAFPSIKRHILDIYNPDVFISTYSAPGYWTVDDNMELDNSSGAYTDSIFKSIDKLYHPKILEVENLTQEMQEYYRDKAKVLFDTYGKRTRWGRVGNIYGMYHKMQKCFKLMERYENDNNISYDMVIRLRPDLIINNISTIFTPSTLYIQERSYDKGFYEDYLFGGNRDDMSKIMNIYDNIELIYKESKCLFDPHDILRGTIAYYNLKPLSFSDSRSFYNTIEGCHHRPI